MNNILVTICARGGSKGIPGKNIKMLNGIPLIAYTIKVGKLFAEKYSADISLSTDDNSIKKVAEQFGLYTVYQRPSEFATDKAGKIEAIKDLLLFEEKTNSKIYDFVLDLDVTSPMRTIEDLENAYNILHNTPAAYNIFSVSPANRNPYFNMVESKNDGFVSLVKKSEVIKCRQEAPDVYDLNASFYFYRRFFFEDGWKTCFTDKSLAYVVPHICFDLDNPIDFVIMEVLLREKLLDFVL